MLEPTSSERIAPESRLDAKIDYRRVVEGDSVQADDQVEHGREIFVLVSRVCILSTAKPRRDRALFIFGEKYRFQCSRAGMSCPMTQNSTSDQPATKRSPFDVIMLPKRVQQLEAELVLLRLVFGSLRFRCQLGRSCS